MLARGDSDPGSQVPSATETIQGSHTGAHGSGGEHANAEMHRMTVSDKSSCPVVRAAARFHHHANRGMIFQHAAKRAEGQALALHNLMIGVSERQFENLFCQVHSNSRSLPRRSCSAYASKGTFSQR